MFDTHESLAVRHTGQLIDQKMSDFMDDLFELLSSLPNNDEQRNTPWFQLLSVGTGGWNQADLDTCYLYILTNFWSVRSIKPPPELFYTRYFQDDINFKVQLRDWCNSDDRHLLFDDAIKWLDSDDYALLEAEYLKEFDEQISAKERCLEDLEDRYLSASTNQISEDGYWLVRDEYLDSKYNLQFRDSKQLELESFSDKWYFIAEQINYVYSIDPNLVYEVQLFWLRVALVSQPITTIWRKKRTYELGIIREKELANLNNNEK